jgi:hypothetical protein
MAYGQIDPARLAGEALTRWYLRSPADIERERQAAAAQNYDDFFAGGSARSRIPDLFSQGPDAASGAADSMAVRSTAGPNRSLSEQAPSSNHPTDAASELEGAGGATAYIPSNTQMAANAWPCAGCHGTGISPFPPAFSKPPWATPWTPGPNTTPRKPAKPHPPQCAMQNMKDSRICSREPYDAWKSVCLRSASEREAYCIANDGQVGWPPLETHDRR